MSTGSKYSRIYKIDNPIAVEEDSINSINAHVDSLDLSASGSTAMESVNELTILKIKSQETSYLDGQYFELDIENSSLTGSVTGICKLCKSEKRIKGTSMIQRTNSVYTL